MTKYTNEEIVKAIDQSLRKWETIRQGLEIHISVWRSKCGFCELADKKASQYGRGCWECYPPAKKFCEQNVMLAPELTEALETASKVVYWLKSHKEKVKDRASD